MFTLITLTLIALSTILASARAYLAHVQQCIKLDALLMHAHTRRRAYNSVRANPPRIYIDTATRPHAHQQPYESAGGIQVTEATMIDYARAIHAQRAAGNKEYTYAMFH